MPAGSKEAYENAEYWKNFSNIVELVPSAIEEIERDSAEATAVGYYSPDGKVVTQPAKGINIIKMTDGTTRKVMVK